MSAIIQLNADPEIVASESAWVGEWHTYVCQLVDENGSPIDVTTGTLAATFTNVWTGAAYSFSAGSVTITKQYAAEGIISILFPSAFPTSALIRITIAVTVSTTVTRYGPLILNVLTP
jgi:hypothetical protein